MADAENNVKCQKREVTDCNLMMVSRMCGGGINMKAQGGRWQRKKNVVSDRENDFMSLV